MFCFLFVFFFCFGLKIFGIIVYYSRNYNFSIYMFFVIFWKIQLSWRPPWTGPMTGICRSALWLCHGWASSRFKKPVFLQINWHTALNMMHILFLCFSLLTTFHPGKKSIKRNTTFTSTRNLFFLRLRLRFSVTCPLLPRFCVMSTVELFLD